MRQFTKALKANLTKTIPKPVPMRSSLRLAKEYQALMTPDLPNYLRQDIAESGKNSVIVNPRIDRPYLTAGGWHKPPIDVTESTQTNEAKEIAPKNQLSDLEIHKIMVNITRYLDRNYQNRKPRK